MFRWEKKSNAYSGEIRLIDNTKTNIILVLHLSPSDDQQVISIYKVGDSFISWSMIDDVVNSLKKKREFSVEVCKQEFNRYLKLKAFI